jgi:hypothetical protein
MRARRSELVMHSPHFPSHGTGLLAPPHGQRDPKLVLAWHVAARKISNCPGEAQYLVDAASAQPTAVHGLVDGLQAVRKWQVSAQVGARDLPVGLPAAAG